MIGRLSEKIGERFQYFPINTWQKELAIGRKLGFDGVEWIISDYSNPIFNYNFILDIKKNLKVHKMKISSISLDFIMKDPLYSINNKDLEWVINRILFLQKNIIIPRITVPIEETSKYRNKIEKTRTLKNLNFILKKLSKNSNISIETDLELREVAKIFNKKKFSKLGLLLDIGNIRASGYNLEKYLFYFKKKIHGIHIKYRNKNFGKSMLIPNKFNELSILKKNFTKLSKIQDITFQTFRSNNNFISDMKENIKNFNIIFNE